MLLPEAGSLAFKSLNVLFFSFSVLFLARELLNTQQNELNKKNEIKVSWYAFLFVVLVCFYPTLFIRMVQIEKDVF